MIIEAGGKKSLRKKERASSAQSNLIWRRMCFLHCTGCRQKRNIPLKPRQEGKLLNFEGRTWIEIVVFSVLPQHPIHQSFSHPSPI